jgi:hypothetical protein
MPTIILPVPNAPGPGAWVDCSGLGQFPEVQLDAAAVAADEVNLETAAMSTAVLGKLLKSVVGGSVSATLLQQNGRDWQSTPIAWGRAVRVGGPTPGLNLNLAASNLANPGPAGPPGFPVQGTMALVLGTPGAFLQPGSRGITSVTTATVNGFKQVIVTFSAPFATANYSVVGNWWNSAAPPCPLQPIAWNDPANPGNDGRTTTTVTFELVNFVGGSISPDGSFGGGITIACG